MNGRIVGILMGFNLLVEDFNRDMTLTELAIEIHTLWMECLEAIGQATGSVDPRSLGKCFQRKLWETYFDDRLTKPNRTFKRMSKAIHDMLMTDYCE